MTIIKENVRKQYDQKDSFRFTTPDVKVVAAPVHAGEQQRLNKVADPSSAAYLAPLSPLNRPGIINPANAVAPDRPISQMVAHHEFSEPDSTAAVIGWLSSAIPQTAQIVNGALEKSAKEEATKAYIDSVERVKSGENVKDVMKSMRPETLVGYAERAYDTQMGEVVYQGFESDVHEFVKRNPEMSVEDMNKGINDMFLDYGAGQSMHLKEAFIPKAADLMGRMSEYQKDTLIKKAGNDFLDAVHSATLSKVMDIKLNTPPEQADQAIRDYVTSVQEDGKLHMVEKDKTTKAILDALGVELDVNSSHYRSPDELLSWTKKKDAQGGFSIYDNAEYKNMIGKYEEKYSLNLRRTESEEHQADAESKKAFVDKYEGIVMSAVQAGKKVDPGMLDEIAKGTHDYDVYKHFETIIDDVNSPEDSKWKSEPEALFNLKKNLLNGNDDQIPEINTIMKAFDDKQISAKDRDMLLGWRTRTAEPIYNASVKQLTAHYKEPGDTSEYVSPRTEMAVDHFNSLIESERTTSGGLPNPKRLHEMVSETTKYVDSVPSTHYKTPESFMQSRTPEQLLNKDISKGYDEFKQSFRNATKQEYMHHMYDYVEKLDKATKETDLWKAVRTVESNGDPSAVSKKGAEGTMQVMPKTQDDPGFNVRPAKDHSPAELERVGRDYLYAMQHEFKNNKDALIAYNMGPGATKDWISNGADVTKLPKETQDYLVKVFSHMQQATAPIKDKSSPVDTSSAWYSKEIDLGTALGKPIGKAAGGIAEYLAAHPSEDKRKLLQMMADESMNNMEHWMNDESIVEMASRHWGESLGINYDSYNPKRRWN